MMSLMDLLQRAWQNEQCPLISGLVFDEGKYLELDVRVGSGPHGGAMMEWTNARYVDLRPQLDPDNLVFVDVFCTVDLGDGAVTCGGGSLGGDGFIAYETPKRRPQWIFFSDRTNPFVSARLTDGVITARSELGFDLVIPVLQPEAAFKSR